MIITRSSTTNCPALTGWALVFGIQCSMRQFLAVPRPELDEMVKGSKETSPRAGNPNAVGRKRRPTQHKA